MQVLIKSNDDNDSNLHKKNTHNGNFKIKLTRDKFCMFAFALNYLCLVFVS